MRANKLAGAGVLPPATGRTAKLQASAVDSTDRREGQAPTRPRHLRSAMRWARILREAGR